MPPSSVILETAPQDTLPKPDRANVLFEVFQNLDQEICSAIARRFRSDKAAAERKTFACQNAVFKAAAYFFVHTEHIADFSAAHAHIACGHVRVGTDMSVKLGHEALAESHDFRVRFAAGVKVRAALAAAHRQSGKAVFEGLLEAQKFHDAEVDGGMESQTAFVRPDCVVELNSVTAVDVRHALVVHPRHSEHDLTVRLNQSFQNSVLSVKLFIRLDNGSERLENFSDSLHKFGLARILRFCCGNYL